MNLEQAIAEIEWLERLYLLLDTRPLQLSDRCAANQKHALGDQLHDDAAPDCAECDADGKFALATGSLRHFGPTSFSRLLDTNTTLSSLLPNDLRSLCYPLEVTGFLHRWSTRERARLTAVAI